MMAVTDMTPANEARIPEESEELVLWTSQIRAKQAAKRRLTREERDWIKWLENDDSEPEDAPALLGVAILDGKRLGIFPDWIDGLRALKRFPPGTVIRTKRGIMARRVPDSWLPDEVVQEESEEDVTEIIQELVCDYAKRSLPER